MPAGSLPVLALALLVGAASSVAVLLRGAGGEPRRIARLLCVLDVVLTTAIVAATGGGRSIFAFLYVLSVTAACVLLSRTGGLAIAGAASILYTGIVLARTVFPTTVFFETPDETAALELMTMFLNTGTFLTVAIVAGGLAEQYRATQQALETQERDLRDLEAFRDLILNSVATGLVALDRGHRITAFNRAAERITGVPARRALGRPWREVLGAADALDTAEAQLEAGSPTPAWQETVFRRPDGGEAAVRLTVSALRAGDGRRIGLIVACEDLSILREMESRMRQADRLATLGRLAANIAHEIRNPLASLTGAIEVLTVPGTGEDARERLSQIVVRESQRLNVILKNFLEYARPAPLAWETVDVAEVLDEVLLLLEHRTLPAGLKIVREMVRPLPWRVDAQQFRQAVWNLCLNAVEAMPDGGELRVSAAVRGRALEIRVTDTGHGIAAADLAHVFEPFYSTKLGGSGLGLALVHRIVRDHGGDVRVASTRGAGTTFTLTLPRRDG